ncbi:hypothetical protein GL213_03450 [Halogeometricum borinquense]|uniref:Uncharacterized protein n=1 Tax=Halogeometricum borinquense (strain ATCC 700274 / DSM 11551 / JCM 10706 / KCTC 4070 / PR3) TaxID=469382 RepID=E4NN61_HALBP|nr:hypothetical protein [Halogeometricum borinquense]ADQ66291.1 hypothetical protein Hbor_06930 [Halogeometricum borinquense DSM 11551]ELY27719.1 hypothetical protein C499_09117 [Halogeometricum borinquense DSM 11551]QIQ75665.1 hypothetical protein GL213_03450 [Halogeometricum borinquense]
MSISTVAAILPTHQFKQNESSSLLNNRADAISNAWETDIEDSSGDYSLRTHTHWDKPVSISSDDAGTARQEAAEYVHNNYSFSSKYDSILVIHDEKWNDNVTGMAPIPPTDGDSDEIAAGNNPQPVAIATTGTLIAAADTHEMGHMYSARHSDHENWGVAEFTVMGNPSSTTCNGNDHTFRTRKNRFSDCDITPIRDYMDNHSDLF